MIDNKGFRLNVGIILVGPEQKVFWAKRYGQMSWQFPQGGIAENEPIEDALFRELHEEVGLDKSDVEVIGSTDNWLSYRLPKHLIRHYRKPVCIGQKQKWYLLRLTAPEQKIRLNLNAAPEFDSWRWVDFWYPLKEVIFFKRSVYQRALKQFEPLIKKGSKVG